MHSRSDWGTSKSSSPVAGFLVTIAIHFLLVLYWYRPVPLLPTRAPTDNAMMITFIKPPAAKPVPPAVVTPMRQAPAASKPRLVRNSIKHEPAAVEPIRAASVPAPVQVPAPPTAPATPAFNAGDILAQARREVGKIDHELRGSAAPASLIRPDSKQARIEQAMSEAFIDHSPAVFMDRYVSGDGVAITRVTTGGRAKCYMSGTANFVPGVLHDSARPKPVSCPPADAGWSRI